VTLELELVIETNISDNIISTIYNQKHKDRLHLVVYFSRKIISAELNYNIYNKELLAIVKALRE
jgi:hypothetical protein